MKAIVNTLNGKVVGNTDGEVRSFLGIRYARADRFRMPETADGLNGEVDATRFSDCCPQYRQFHDESLSKNTFYFDEFRRGLTFTYSEDCLRLNVYAPEKAENLPVILFAHGGSFVRGSGNERTFDGYEYAKRNVIMVTINYRLNVFGFYADKKICNLALYDMLSAIKFIKNNISAFGGDGNNITVMGQSAGAMCLTALIQNDEVKKDVKGAILLSGGGLLRGLYAPKSKKRAEKFFKGVGELLKADNKDIFTAGYQDVYKAYEAASKKRPLTALLSTTPVFDGKLIDKRNYKNFESIPQLPCIISVTKDDLFLKNYVKRSAKDYADKCPAPVWLLQFDRNLPGDDKGAWHSCDLWYAFGTLREHPYRKFEKHDIDLSDEIISRYCSFARSQNPNAASLSDWQPKTTLTLK